MSLEYTSSEMMSVTAARALENGSICFVGIGLPSEAANLARLTHAPDVVLIYESGTLQTKPNVLPLSIGDGELAETALPATVGALWEKTTTVGALVLIEPGTPRDHSRLMAVHDRLLALGARVDVRGQHEALEDLLATTPDAVLVGPGPGTPDTSGVTLALSPTDIRTMDVLGWTRASLTT